jgi:ribonuclease D
MLWSHDFTLLSFLDWHILSDPTIKSIAAFAPTTEDELVSMGLLGEQKMKDYGSRLVRKVKQFVEKNGLEDFVANRAGKRTRTDDSATTEVAAVVVQSASSSAVRTGKPKARKAIIEIEDDDGVDEFGAAFDYSMSHRNS